MKRGILILVFVLLWSLAANAQDDYGENRIGIFADVDGLVNEVEVQAGTPLEVFLLIINPTGIHQLGGAEWSLVAPDNMTIWGWSFPMAGVLAISDPPDFMVVWTPVPFQTVHHVMTFIITPADSDPGVFFIDKYYRPSMGDAPLFLDVEYPSTDGGILVSLDPIRTVWGNLRSPSTAGPCPTSPLPGAT